jgi:hypothetical protein
MRPYKIDRDKPSYMGRCECGIWLRTEERFKSGMCAKCFRSSQKPKLDPDADGKQWTYRGFYIVDQRAYKTNDIPAYCVQPMYGGSVYPAASLKDAAQTIDRLLLQEGDHNPKQP